MSSSACAVPDAQYTPISRYGRTDDDIPTLIFWTGGNDPKALKAAREGKAPPPPSNHSPFFAPIAEPALKTGVQAMTAGALELFSEEAGDD